MARMLDSNDFYAAVKLYESKKDYEEMLILQLKLKIVGTVYKKMCVCRGPNDDASRSRCRQNET